MNSKPPAQSSQRKDRLSGLFAGLFGAFLGLCLLKFGNPPITEKWVTAPTSVWEFLLGYPWPIGWAYGVLAIVAVAGIIVSRWHRAVPWWLVALPAAWLAWEFIASTQSVDAGLSRLTLKHFVACVACFYLGYFSLSRGQRLWLFWLGLMCGFALVLVVGWEQQFGGLKESRRYFFLYVYPTMKEVPPEYLKKITSDRIFSTLFYPNALAGVLLLLLPAAMAALWELQRLLTAGARGFLLGLVGMAGLACLYWSGSKGGWLVMLALSLVALLRVRFSRQLKVILVATILVAGLAGFFWKYAAFFEKGAKSVGARFDYWRAAIQTTAAKPLFGTGPGTFAIAYERVKRPESEMARLTHNDYLEQASDSGLAGFVAYTAFIMAGLVWGYPRGRRNSAAGPGNWLRFAVWLGVLGWSLQSLFEFGLYLPAIAWPAFTLLGWLLGCPAPPPESIRQGRAASVGSGPE